MAFPGPTSKLIQTVTTGHMNDTLGSTSGFDVAYHYNLTINSMGNFIFDVIYNITDKDESKQFEGD